jgi:hypothetical protein
MIHILLHIALKILFISLKQFQHCFLSNVSNRNTPICTEFSRTQCSLHFHLISLRGQLTHATSLYGHQRELVEFLFSGVTA